MIGESNTAIKRPDITAVPNPEVSAKAARRTFTAEYKRRILKEAEACSKPGEIGSLLRREGLYSSSLTLWRRQIHEGLNPKRRGPSPRPREMNIHRIAQLEKENARLAHKLKQAELIIEVQKKVAALLQEEENEEKNS